jgi:hypothetical protein
MTLEDKQKNSAIQKDVELPAVQFHLVVCRQLWRFCDVYISSDYINRIINMGRTTTSSCPVPISFLHNREVPNIYHKKLFQTYSTNIPFKAEQERMDVHICFIKIYFAVFFFLAFI